MGAGRVPSRAASSDAAAAPHRRRRAGQAARTTALERLQGIDMTEQAIPTVNTRVRKRVLVVDDSFVTRNMVRQIVESDPDLEVVDTAENGVAALKKVQLIKPDVVLLDIEMPQMSGLETLRRLGLRSSTKV